LNGTEHLLVGLTCVVVLGVGVQWLAWRLRLPSILLLLAAGYLAGPVTGIIDPDRMFGDLLLPIVSLSVGLVLFEGALSLRLDELRNTGSVIRNLVTIGALVTWLLGAAGAHFLLDFKLPSALLLGAILVVTGPTVVGPILRHVRPSGQVGPIAKWEGIVIDPIGAVLAVLVFEAIRAAQSGSMQQVGWGVMIDVLWTIAVATVVGVAGALLIILFLRKYWIPDFLQSPVLLMVAVACFTSSNVMQHESGLLTVTLLGVILANQKWVTIGHLIEFKENLRVLLISTLFILLAARFQPSELGTLGFWSIGFLAFLLVVVRPVAVLASTIGSRLNCQERMFLAWLAPRGVVAVSFAAVFALRAGELGEGLVAVTFMVVVGTVAIYGLTITPLARVLGVADPNPQGLLIAGASPLARAIGLALQEAGFKVLLVDCNRVSISNARLEGLPAWYGSILSNQALDDLDLGGIGRFLALTPSGEVNSLAAWHFRDVFGRAGVYQLPPTAARAPRGETAEQHLRGRFAFTSDATYGYLQSRLAQGAVIKKTRLTEEFDYEAFQSHYGNKALPLFLISGNKKLTVFTATEKLEPKPGSTLISLVQPEEDK